jgi:hypothetical protein
MEIDKVAKDINRLNLTTKKLASTKPIGDFARLELLKKALSQSQAIAFHELSNQLSALLDDTQKRIDNSLEQRREVLLKESRDAGLNSKRFGEYDRIDVFKVSYKGKKVSLEIGSEPVAEFEESDGSMACLRIQEERRKLEESSFKRERFFQLLRYSYFLSQQEQKVADQWAPIRTIYTCLTLVRNLDSESFVKTPLSKRFIPYTSAQFVFDLARFGRSGWTCGNHILRSQTPNMSTVAAKKTMTLPDLDSPDKLGAQIAVIKIVKSD